MDDVSVETAIFIALVTVAVVWRCWRDVNGARAIARDALGSGRADLSHALGMRGRSPCVR